MLLMYPSRCKFSSTASSSCICVKNDCHRVKTQLQLNKYYYTQQSSNNFNEADLHIYI